MSNNINIDYSFFGNTTAYEKHIIDILRNDGLSNAEIIKLLAEL